VKSEASDDVVCETAADGTAYLKAFNNAAPTDVRAAVDGGTLLWSVPWRAAGEPYFRLYGTSRGPVLMTDIGIGWSYSWDWPDPESAVRHVRRHTAEADLKNDAEYIRRRVADLSATILQEGPLGFVIDQRGHVRAVLRTADGPETRWYPGAAEALDDAAQYAVRGGAWAGRLTETPGTV
jgi:hypothetical protein